jgi:DNA-binding response OmpR family regulator
VANILIIDNQKWVLDLCEEGLTGEEHLVSATDDIETVRENILSLKPDLVLLNLYLKYGTLVWDVLKDIKRQGPDLPVIIVTLYNTNLYNKHLDQADGYLIKDHLAPAELRQKITALLSRNHIFNQKQGLLYDPDRNKL